MLITGTWWWEGKMSGRELWREKLLLLVFFVDEGWVAAEWLMAERSAWEVECLFLGAWDPGGWERIDCCVVGDPGVLVLLSFFLMLVLRWRALLGVSSSPPLGENLPSSSSEEESFLECLPDTMSFSDSYHNLWSLSWTKWTSICSMSPFP